MSASGLEDLSALAGTPSFMECDAGGGGVMGAFSDDGGSDAAADDDHDLLANSSRELSIPLHEDSLRPPPTSPADGHGQVDQDDAEDVFSGSASSRPLVTSPAPSTRSLPAATADGTLAHHNDKDIAGHPRGVGDVASSLGLRSGFALRGYEEELGRLKKENFQLKLRIYFLEERHGLLPSKEDKENVFRINVDLRVENKAMKEETVSLRRELQEKTQLLLEINEAIDEQERERLRERSDYESRIESLRQSLFESQMHFGVSKAGDDSQQHRESLDAAERRCGEQQERIAEQGKELDELRVVVNQLENAMSSKDEQLKSVMQRKGQAENELEEFKVSEGQLKTVLDEKEIELKKTQHCMEALLAESVTQSTQICDLQGQVRSREEALQLLRKEYESAKAKVRKCREEHKAERRASTVSSSSSNIGKADASNQTSRRKNSLDCGLRDDGNVSIASVPPRRNTRERALQSWQQPPQDLNFTEGTEVEFRSVRALALKSPRGVKGVRVGGGTADIPDFLVRALNRAAEAYTAACQSHAWRCRRTLALLARRIADLVDFLSNLFALERSGALDFSAMSESMRENMHRSMDEGRRLSQSLLQHSEMQSPQRRSTLPNLGEDGCDESLVLRAEDANETQRDTEASPEDVGGGEGGTELDIPRFRLPEVDLGALVAEERRKDHAPEAEDKQNQTEGEAIKLETALSVVEALRQEKADLEQQLKKITADLWTNIREVNVELKKLVCENATLQVKLDEAEVVMAETKRELQEAEQRDRDRDQRYCDCVKRIKELERLLAEAHLLHKESQTKLDGFQEERLHMRAEAIKQVHKANRALKVANRSLGKEDRVPIREIKK